MSLRTLHRVSSSTEPRFTTKPRNDNASSPFCSRSLVTNIDGLHTGLRIASEVLALDSRAFDFSQGYDTWDIEGLDLRRTVQYPRGDCVAFAKTSAIDPSNATSYRLINSSSPLRGHDWSPILQIRGGMEYIWQRLMSFSGNVPLSVIIIIREAYGCFREFCETGIRSIRKALSSAAPSNFKEIFALTSMAHVISILLNKAGRMSEQDILADLHVWRDAILDLEEREAFRVLVELMWPDVKRHLNSPLAQYDPLQPTLPPRLIPSETHGFRAVPSPNSQSTDIPDSVVPADVSGRKPYDTTQSPHRLVYPSLNLKHPVPCASYQMHGQGDIFKWHQSTASGHEEVSPCDLLVGLPSEDRVGREAPGGFSSTPLKQTKMFYAIEIFCAQMGELPFFLTGMGMTAKDPLECLAYAARNSTALEHIRQALLESLYHRPGFGNAYFRGLLSATEMFIEHGCLQSIGKVSRYMLTVGEVSHCSLEISITNVL